MEVVVWLLPDSPDNVHGFIKDVVIGLSVRLHLLPEQDRSLSIFFESNGSGQVVGPTPEGIQTRSRPWEKKKKLKMNFEKMILGSFINHYNRGSSVNMKQEMSSPTSSLLTNHSTVLQG